MLNPTQSRLGALNSNPHAGGIEIRVTPDVREFAISREPAMPVIQVQASVVGVPALASGVTMFEWTATLEFNPAQCPYGIPPAYPPLRLSGVSMGGAFAIRFGEIRGGRLTIDVRARVPSGEIVAQRNDLQIVGTNPLYMQLTQALPSKVVRAIVWHESRGRQFLGTANGGTSGCPLYSHDRYGGVGLMQLTRPAPTHEQTWNWRANLAGGLALFEVKKGIARAYPAKYRASSEFTKLVAAFNAERAGQKLPPLQISIPDFTPEQVELDALRGYNGWSANVHEFRAARDAAGKLIVDINKDGKTGSARWEQVSATTRDNECAAAGIAKKNRGDVDYVQNIMRANVPF